MDAKSTQNKDKKPVVKETLYVFSDGSIWKQVSIAKWVKVGNVSELSNWR